MVRYAILGPVELCDGERGVRVGGPRQVALLALLLVNANSALSSDRLIDALWGDLRRAGALKRLQVAITRLRRTLEHDGAQGGSVLRTVAGGYLLAVRPGELDAEVFQTRVQEGRRALQAGDTARGLEELSEALGLWRGPALAQVAYEEFAQPEIRRLEELRLTALEARLDCELQLGEHSGVVGELEGLVAAHPGRERLVGQLMLAMYRCGRQADALEVYARTRAYLSRELGLEPGPALRDLQVDVLAHSPALQPGADEPGPAAALPTGVVTFMLTDIEGSTSLWEADADAMAAALELLEELIARCVEGHDGRLLKNKGEGDATLSVFQRASDAVACSAELQRAVAAAAWPSRLRLHVRIALHSGEAQERDSDYFGPVLNRAARLRSLAPGGVTVVSQSTAELVRDRLAPEMALVDLGRHELRGMSRPERVFELRASQSAAAHGSDMDRPVTVALARSLRAPAGSPFVGRDAELEHLCERWRVSSGERIGIVVGGEPGIGKTRLASEFAGILHEQGVLVLYGRCDEGLAVPYQPFVEALRPYARAVGLNRLRADLADLAPDLGRLLPELAVLGEPIRGEPESERFALFEAVAALIETMTRKQRALLVLDDLHWAATPTLLLLRHLLRSERPLGALVLCTYRETELEPGQPLAQLIADLHRDASAERMSIRGLDQHAITALLEAAVGHPLDQRDSQLADILATQTGGNPFFIRELLAHLGESGTLSGADERSTPGATAAQLQAPERLRYVIAQRVARLSAPARRTLRLAAVAAHAAAFSFALLERVLGDRPTLLDALDEAVAAGLLTEAGPGHYAFAHALVRQTIYGQLGSTRRVHLHRQLGEALETLDKPEAYVEALAHHFAYAAADGQADKAADYALAAGRSATSRLGYEEAVAHYERGLQALTLTGQTQEKRRCELLLALGQARWGAGQLDNARQTYRQAAELADELRDATALGQAAVGFCGPPRVELAPAVTQPVAGLLQRALTVLDRDDSVLRAQLMARLAAYTDAEDKRVLARQALEMARRVADKATVADVLVCTHWATRGPDTAHESMAQARELALVADKLGDQRLLRVVAQWWLLDSLLEVGDIEAVERELKVLRILAEPRREREIKWLLAVAQAGHSLLQGRLEDCERLAHEGLTHRFEGHDEPAAYVFAAQMFCVRGEQGRLNEIVETIKSNAEQNPRNATWCCVLTAIYAQLRRTAQARHEFEALARDDFADLPRDAFWLPSMAALSGAAVLLGDARRAQQLYKLLLPYADRCAVTIALLCVGSVSRPLGSLATTLSRYEDASRHFEQALKMNAQIRSPIWIAHTQHDYARMLLLRHSPGDNERALELLTEALTTAQALGLTALTERARPMKLAAAVAGSFASSCQPRVAQPDAPAAWT